LVILDQKRSCGNRKGRRTSKSEAAAALFIFFQKQRPDSDGCTFCAKKVTKKIESEKCFIVHESLNKLNRVKCQ